MKYQNCSTPFGVVYTVSLYSMGFTHRYKHLTTLWFALKMKNSFGIYKTVKYTPTTLVENPYATIKPYYLIN
jgi:hypothetical protein